MSWLSDIGAIDIRAQLPRRPWVVGERQASLAVVNGLVALAGIAE